MNATSLSQITREHLGSDATEDDLDLFRSAVTALIDGFGYEDPAAVLDEASAIEFVWNDGDWMGKAVSLAGGSDTPVDGYYDLLEDCRRQNAVDAEALANLVNAKRDEEAEHAATRALDRELYGR